MRRDREEVKKRFLDDEEATKRLASNKSKMVYLLFLTDQQLKSYKQNRLFHGLLTCFDESGCSSFGDYDEMRKHYKEKAGLIKVEYGTCLSAEAKRKIHNATKDLDIGVVDKVQLVLLLKGRTLKEQSWGDVSKEQARFTCDMIINDMIQAGVNTPKFQKIMKALEEGKYGDNLINKEE